MSESNHTDRLAEIKARHAAATPGEWTYEVNAYNDGAFDAHYTVRTVEKHPRHPWSPRFIAWMTGCLRADLPLSSIKGAKFCRECERWHFHNREVGVDVRSDPTTEADAAFIASAPTDIAYLIARVEQLEAAQAWRLVETAPRDGTAIDVWDSYGNRTPDARWVGDRWASWGLDGFGSPGWVRVEPEPTHWMPLPAAPSTKEGA